MRCAVRAMKAALCVGMYIYVPRTAHAVLLYTDVVAGGVGPGWRSGTGDWTLDTARLRGVQMRCC